MRAGLRSVALIAPLTLAACGSQAKLACMAPDGRTAPTGSVNLDPASSAPVITQQPIGMTVTAGDEAVLKVAALCASGRLQVQWQESVDGGFVDVPNAAHTRYSFETTQEDSGSRYRAWLSCGGTDETYSRVVAIAVPVPAAGFIP
jgi:hypothetical protein